MTVKQVILAILNAAVAKYPAWAWLFNLVKPFLTAVGVAGSATPIGETTPPEELIALVTNFLNSLIDRSNRPLIKLALKTLVTLAPFLIDIAWAELFPAATKPKTFHALPPAPDIETVVLEADMALGF